MRNNRIGRRDTTYAIVRDKLMGGVQPEDEACETRMIFTGQKQVVNGFVYVIRADDIGIKIGYSAKPYKRLAELQIGCPTELKMVASALADRGVEKKLHTAFASQRLHGEWFSEEIAEPVVSILKALA